MGQTAHRSAVLLATVLFASGTCAALAANSSLYGPPTRERMPSSSRCAAECNAMEVKCEELERLFPACGVADICIEEKEACMEKCRYSASLCPAGSEPLKASG